MGQAQIACVLRRAKEKGKMIMSQDGIFDAKAIKGTEQWGPSANGHPQLRLMLSLKGEGQWQTDLIFSPDSAHFSQDRLKAMGWDGHFYPNDHPEFPGLPNLASIFGMNPPETSKVFKVRRRTEMYQGSPQTKVEIFTGAAPLAPYASSESAKGAGAALQAMLKAPRPERKRGSSSSADGMPDDDFFR